MSLNEALALMVLASVFGSALVAQARGEASRALCIEIIGCLGALLLAFAAAFR